MHRLQLPPVRGRLSGGCDLSPTERACFIADAIERRGGASAVSHTRILNNQIKQRSVSQIVSVMNDKDTVPMLIGARVTVQVPQYYTSMSYQCLRTVPVLLLCVRRFIANQLTKQQTFSISRRSTVLCFERCVVRVFHNCHSRYC